METQTTKGGHFKRPEGGAGALEAQKRQDCFWLEKSGKVRLGKMVFESGLEDRGLCSEKEEIREKKIKVPHPHVLLTLSVQSLLIA